MTSPVLLLVEDERSRGWDPVAPTRPVGELLHGALLQRERIALAAGLPVAGYVGAPELAGFEEESTPPVLLPDAVPGDRPRFLLSSRFVPATGPGALLAGVVPPHERGDGGPVHLATEGGTAGWYLPAGTPAPPSGGAPSAAGTHAEHALPGRLLPDPWDLVEENPAQLRADLGEGGMLGALEELVPLPDLPGVTRIGSARVTAEDGVAIDPTVVLDTREGPIHLSRGVRIAPFTHLRGPAWIGRETHLLGGTFEAISCGPVCRLRGEVSTTIVLGFANKAHDGYLGHALVGRWVNLGALTTNSDLKNNYGRVRVGRGPTREVNTGRLKVGVFLGDHVKTGIGTLLGAGTVVGAGSNVFGGAAIPKWVPPFSWLGPGVEAVHRLDAFLQTAERAMGRRGVDLSPSMRALLVRTWQRFHRGRG